MKKFVALLLALVLCLSLVACGEKKDNQPEQQQPQSTSKLVEGDAKYNTMTDAELYEEAKKEGGTIVVYSDTSKISKIGEAFQKAYPDLKIETQNLKKKETMSKVPIEVSTGNRVADVLTMNDATGQVYMEFYDDGYVETYFPANIVKHIDPEVIKTGLPLYIGSNCWFYNTEMYPNGCPINNWWDIVEKNADGTQKYAIFCKNIAGEDSYMGLYAQLASQSKEMEAAYKAKYGKDIAYTYDASKVPGVEANNAAYEWLYQFAQMDITFIDDGDDIMKALNDNTKPSLGIGSANKLDNREDNGYHIAWCVGMVPFTGLSNPQYTYIVKGTDNPAGARLLINFMMGGENNDTKAVSIFERLGQWYFRDDMGKEVNDYSFAEMHLQSPNLEYIYNNYLNINDFWIYWYDSFH